jgi:hypothetical protein
MRPGLPELQDPELNSELNEEALVNPIDSSDVGALYVEPSYDEIAAEAYARYLSRGRADGGDITDWLEAEQMLRLRRRSAE